MQRFVTSFAVVTAGGVLLGACGILAAAEENAVANNAAMAESQKEAKRWIDQLGSERFHERDQAARELSRLGKSALPNLKDALKSPDAEVRRRAQQLVEQIEAPPIRATDLQRPVPAFKSYL